MRCKKHTDDFSSAYGVCASCLRERLFAVMAAQPQKETNLHRLHVNRRKSDKQQKPFPRSVSPYISRRESTNCATWQLHGHHQRFFMTPQVGPNGSVNVEVEMKQKEKKKKSSSSSKGRISSLFWGLFRSKFGKPDSESAPVSDPGGSNGYSFTPSSSWFSAIFPGRRKEQTRPFSLDEGTMAARRKVCQYRDRGMSPVGYSDEDDDDEHCHGGSSGYSSESSQGWRHTPRMTPATVRWGAGRGFGLSRNVSSLAFCLSPMVRASPTRHWNQIGLPAEAGESRAPPMPHPSATASFCKNRSRKLADFGRYGYKANH